MTDEQFEQRVAQINQAEDLGYIELSRQLSWALWEDLEGPREPYLKEEVDEAAEAVEDYVFWREAGAK